MGDGEENQRQSGPFQGRFLVPSRDDFERVYTAVRRLAASMMWSQGEPLLPQAQTVENTVDNPQLQVVNKTATISQLQVIEKTVEIPLLQNVDKFVEARKRSFWFLSMSTADNDSAHSSSGKVVKRMLCVVVVVTDVVLEVFPRCVSSLPKSPAHCRIPL